MLTLIRLEQDPSYIIPSRGFLVQLLPGGCTPESPLSSSDLAYLKAYNQSHAAYTCKVSVRQSPCVMMRVTF